MDTRQIKALLLYKKGTIFMLALLLAALSFLVLVIKEKNFKVSSDYLIVQNQNQSGPQDPYSLAKLADYNGKLYNEAIYSEVFINEVIKTGKVNSEFLPFDKKDKLKSWNELVSVKQNPDVGILSVTVFNNNSAQARNISDAIAQVLTQKNFLFRGDGQNIDIRILSGPIEEKNPSWQNIIAAIGGGFIFGLLIVSLWIVLQEDQRKKRIHEFEISKLQNVFGRMQQSGNFMSEQEYKDSLEYIR